MKSHFLGILVVLLLSAVYVTSNSADVTVNFLRFSYSFPQGQGLWDVILFVSGALLMWFFSAFACLETYYANKKTAKEMGKKIEELEDEKKSLLAAMRNIGAVPRVLPPSLTRDETAGEQAGAESRQADDEQPKAAVGEGSLYSRVKNFLPPLFGRDKKTGGGVSAETPPESADEAVSDSPDEERKETLTV